MALKQEFANQIQAQIDVWQAQIKEHQERLGEAGAAASAEYEKAMATSKRQRIHWSARWSLSPAI